MEQRRSSVEVVKRLHREAEDALARVGTHVLTQDSMQLRRRSFLYALPLLGLENASELDVAMRAARWTCWINGHSAQLVVRPHMRRTVAPIKVAPLCTSAGSSVKPVELLELAPKAAAIRRNRTIESPAGMRGRHVPTGYHVAKLCAFG
eukprot:2447977-Pleurochrysis_carterae.AAC.1